MKLVPLVKETLVPSSAATVPSTRETVFVAGVATDSIDPDGATLAVAPMPLGTPAAGLLAVAFVLAPQLARRHNAAASIGSAR
jgi:hypothetical protein